MVELAIIKQLDEKMTAELERDRAAKRINPSEFKAKVVKLLIQIAQAADRVTAIEDYSWLDTAATRWRTTAASVLGDPIPISIPMPAPHRLSPPRSERIWVKSSLDEWIRNKSWEIFKRRAISRYYTKSEEEILAETPSTLEDYERDGYAARIYLASEVLDGRFDFARDFNAESYPLLEGDCWLREVKQLKAYFVWRKQARYWETTDTDYDEACSEIRNRALNPAVKSSQTAFECIAAYLQTQYLRCEEEKSWRVDPAKVEDVIKIKARRIWELTGSTDHRSNWHEAEQYVHEFYSNILCAVEVDDEQAIGTIAALLQLGGTTTRVDLANCFEAAIAIHFLNASKLRGALGVAAACAAA